MSKYIVELEVAYGPWRSHSPKSAFRTTQRVEFEFNDVNQAQSFLVEAMEAANFARGRILENGKVIS